jgi:hypothetical protein
MNHIPRPYFLVLAACIGWFGLVMARSYPAGQWPWIFMSNADLIFHEAGHPLFGLFGEVLGAAGGCIMQLLVPVVCFVAFYREGREEGVAFCLFWIGENLINVGYYAGDARVMALPLISDSATHDWNWLLTHFNGLPYDMAIGGMFRVLGTIAMFIGFLAAVRAALKS